MYTAMCTGCNSSRMHSMHQQVNREPSHSNSISLVPRRAAPQGGGMLAHAATALRSPWGHYSDYLHQGVKQIPVSSFIKCMLAGLVQRGQVAWGSAPAGSV